MRIATNKPQILKIILGVILLVGLAFFGGRYYRDLQRHKRVEVDRENCREVTGCYLHCDAEFPITFGEITHTPSANDLYMQGIKEQYTDAYNKGLYDLASGWIIVSYLYLNPLYEQEEGPSSLDISSQRSTCYQACNVQMYGDRASTKKSCSL